MSKINFRVANLNDVDNIGGFLNIEVEKGIILHRDNIEISQHIRSYILATIDDMQKKDIIVGVGALHIHTPILGEVRSLMVADKYRNNEIGSKIILSLLKNAKVLGMSEVLVLTYKKYLFEKLGFIVKSKDTLPTQKIWQDCIKCKFFPKCDEILLLKTI